MRLPGQFSVDHQVVREDEGRYSLIGSKCPECGRAYYPPRELCVDDLIKCEEIELSSRGQIYESVVIEVAPEGFDSPYRVGYVDLAEQVRVFAPIRWQADVPPKAGDMVELTIEQVRKDPQVIGPTFVGPV
jgi:uncharacterized OB-fold protein